MTDDAVSPEPMTPTAAIVPMRKPRRVWRWLGGAGATLVVLVLLLVGALLWAVHSPYGTAWLLGWAPQLSVVGPKGSLIGDFAAERVDVTLPGSGVIRLDAPRWQALSAARGEGDRWLHLRIAALHADRLSWLPAADAAASAPAQPPKSLRLPLEIEVASASIDELRIGASASDTPVQALRGRVHLGADGGARHRFDDLAASYDRARVTGSGSIGADAPFAVTLDATLTAVDAALPWQASLGADGPLEALNVRAQARVAAGASHAAQALDAHAVVRPFAAWPLGELQATTDALDLSVFASAAPATALSGRAVVTTTGVDRPAVVSLDLANGRAGHWNEGLLPIAHIIADLRARPNAPDRIEVQALSAELGSAGGNGGRVVGRASGRATAGRRRRAPRVRPSALDARAPDVALDGKASLVGTGFANGAKQALVAITCRSRGPIRRPAPAEKRTAPALACASTRPRRPTRSTCASPKRAPARRARASPASCCAARATRRGARAAASSSPPSIRRSGGRAAPARHSRAARIGSTRRASSTSRCRPPAWRSTTRSRRRAAAHRSRSPRARSPASPSKATQATSTTTAAPARRSISSPPATAPTVKGRSRHAAAATTTGSSTLDAPALDRLAPWLGVAATGKRAETLAGALTAKAHVGGRWPAVRATGELHGAGLRYQTLTMRRAEGRWQLGTQGDAPLDATIALDGIDASGRAIEHAGLRISGTARAHRGELRIESAALPRRWADALAARSSASGMTTTAAATPSPASAPTATTSTATANTTTSPAPTSPAAPPSSIVEGGLVDANGERNAGWQGSVRELFAQSLAAPTRTWLRARDVRGSVFWAGGPARASLEAGSAAALGATLRWSRIAWQAGQGASAGHLDAQATIDPLPLAPILRVLQPDFGWGGDLAVGARIDVRSAPTTVVDVVVERAGGDLTVTDEISTQALGFTDLRLGIAAQNGVWSFGAGIAGTALGVASGAVVARTSASAPWPEATTPIEGVLELRVAKLGAWGTWVPAGWRLDGELHASASFGGRFGAPTYTGRVEGSTWRFATSCRACTSATATSRSRCRERARRSSASPPRPAPAPRSSRAMRPSTPRRSRISRSPPTGSSCSAASTGASSPVAAPRCNSTRRRSRSTAPSRSTKD